MYIEIDPPNRRGLARALSPWLLPLTLALSACGLEGDAGEQDEQLRLAESTAALGDVNGTFNQHLNPMANNTALSSLSSSGNLVTTFSAHDPQLTTYRAVDGTRTSLRNMSELGFTTYNVNSKSIVASGRVRPPNGWGMLWGAAAVTRNRTNENLVYLAQPAVPNEKMPADGIVYDLVNTTDASLCLGYSGGACIARSSNGGLSFTAASADCVRRVTTSCPRGTFYRGSDLETSSDGRVYAAFWDLSRNRIDVYMSTSPNGVFLPITDVTTKARSAPRLKWGTNGLYLMFSDGNNIVVQRYTGGASRSGTWTAPVIVGPTNLAIGVFLPNPAKPGTGMGISAGQPGFDFEIGLNELLNEELRVVYVKELAGHKRIMGARCTATSSTTCTSVPGWTPQGLNGGASEQFNPTIAYGLNMVGLPVWGIAYSEATNSNSKVSLMKGVISSAVLGIPTVITDLQEPAQSPCGDSDSHWGEFDGMTAGPNGTFYRGFNDSSHLFSCPYSAQQVRSQAALSGWAAF